MRGSETQAQHYRPTAAINHLTDHHIIRLSTTNMTDAAIGFFFSKSTCFQRVMYDCIKGRQQGVTTWYYCDYEGLIV